MKFDDLIETIDMLSAAEADKVIDWQMTDSPAAKVQRQGDGPVASAHTAYRQRIERLVYPRRLVNRMEIPPHREVLIPWNLDRVMQFGEDSPIDTRILVARVRFATGRDTERGRWYCQLEIDRPDMPRQGLSFYMAEDLLYCMQGYRHPIERIALRADQDIVLEASDGELRCWLETYR